MSTEELIDRVKSLSADEQSSVVRFIDYLERCHAPLTGDVLPGTDVPVTRDDAGTRKIARAQKQLALAMELRALADPPASSPFLQAAEQFMAQHPELLRSLSQ